MLPIQDTNHVAEAQGLTTSRYQSAPVVQGIIAAITARLQQLENDAFAIINAVQLTNHPMAGGPWDILDKLGAIVGVVRNGLSDADFLTLIKLQARVNRSRGLVEDVIQLAKVMAGSGTPMYVEGSSFWAGQGLPISGWQAEFYLGCWNVAGNYPLFVPLLKQIRPAGVYSDFHYSTWADGNDFEFGSVYDANAGQGTFGSVYDATVGGLLVAGVAL